MKWKVPMNWETRTRKMFCWLPLLWHGVSYWLEWVFVKEEYYSSSRIGFWEIIEVNSQKSERRVI